MNDIKMEVLVFKTDIIGKVDSENARTNPQGGPPHHELEYRSGRHR